MKARDGLVGGHEPHLKHIFFRTEGVLRPVQGEGESGQTGDIAAAPCHIIQATLLPVSGSTNGLRQ